MDDPHAGFVPWSKRNASPEPKVEEKLTENTQNRLANVISEYSTKEEIIKTSQKYEGEFGKVEGGFIQKKPVNDLKRQQIDLLKHVDRNKALTYMELLLNTSWSEYNGHRSRVQELMKRDSKIRRALTEERILLELKPEREKLPNNFGKEKEKLYDPDEFESFQFEKLADQSFIEADQGLRGLTKGARWKDELTGYNTAWELYEKGMFTYVIAEKLYNSLEAVVQKICVELEGWEEAGTTVGTCLSTMREKGLFDPNDTMLGEWQQIYGGLQTGIQKLGSDRKRHEEFDQGYVILLLHQTSAFLTFVIKRYEQQYG